MVLCSVCYGLKLMGQGRGDQSHIAPLNRSKTIDLKLTRKVYFRFYGFLPSANLCLRPQNVRK